MHDLAIFNSIIQRICLVPVKYFINMKHTPLILLLLEKVRFLFFFVKSIVLLVQLLKQFKKNCCCKLQVQQQRKQHTIGFVDPNYVVTKCQPAAAFCCLCSILTMRCLCLVCALLSWNGVIQHASFFMVDWKNTCLNQQHHVALLLSFHRAEC